MSPHSRYAIYYLPDDEVLADFGADWLGWDIRRAVARPQPEIPGIADVTLAPRKYGFHATLKPPFRLIDGAGPQDLAAAVEQLAVAISPAKTEGLALKLLGRFFALTPVGDSSELGHVAAACVTRLDAYRAPASETELMRRRQADLSARQEALLQQWGYPYVLDEFRFHLTLTGKVAATELDRIRNHIELHLPTLSEPFVLSSICLCGERPDGQFELIQRYDLRG